MSSDSNHQAAHTDERNEIAQIVSSRKRKLKELFCVATAAGPNPKARPQTDQLQSNALDTFLEQNNLEKGFYFQHATLPTRSWSHNASIPDHTPQPSSSHFASSTTQTKTSASAVDAGARRGDASNALATIGIVAKSVETQTDELERRTRDRPKVPSIAQDGHFKQTRDMDKPKTVMRLSGVVVPQGRPSPRPESPRLIIQADRSPDRRTLIKPSRPASPPYSPGTEPTRIGHAGGEDLTARVPLDEPANVLTPRRDEHDTGQGAANDSSIYTLGAVRDSAATSSGDRQDDSSIISNDTSLGERLKVASHAVHTSASNETPYALDSAQNLDLPGTHSSATSMPSDLNANLHVSGSGPLFRDSGHPVEINGVARAGAEVASAPPRTELPTTTSASDRASTVPDSHGAVTSANAMNPEHATDSSEMTSVETGHSKPSIRANQSNGVTPKLRRLTPHSPHRVRKRRPRRRGQASKIVLCRLSDERHLETLRHIRTDLDGADPRHLSYMRPLFQSQVLSSEVPKGLDQLLKDAPKFVSTTDFMSGISEEQDVRILERIRHLQFQGRWSLRQPIASLEPPSSSSHWDVVVESAQWLRADFREERKLKIRTAKLLADWCSEWVTSSSIKRAALEIVQKPRVSHSGDDLARSHDRNATATSPSHVVERRSGAHDVTELFCVSGTDVLLGETKIRLSETVLQTLPSYRFASPLEGPTNRITANEGAFASPNPRGAIRMMKAQSPELSGSFEGGTKHKGDDSFLPPEDTSCALFDPDSRALRSRLNAPWAFKPPTVSMPPQAFYEHRMASQWNWEDDQLLKQYTKDFPSNWPLIADRMAPRSMFTSYLDRRTPWECYERLLATEGPPADAQARQYLRHFPYRLEKARASFDKHQSAVREQAETNARNAGHPVPPLPQKRFPTPLRVERKPNKRLLAVLDGARKLARKREQNAAKQQNQPHQEGQAQRPAPTRLQPVQTPQYFSKMKHDAEVKEAQRMQTMREQQATLMEQHRRQSGGQNQQTQARGGVAQPTRPRVGVGQPAATGQLGGQMANQTRLHPQPGLPMAMPNGLLTNAQTAVNARPQANMQGQQRIAPHMNGQTVVSQEAMSARMAQQMQQRAYQQMQVQQQQQQHSAANQFHHGSPSGGIANGVPPPGMIGAFNNNAMNNSHNQSTHDILNTTGLPHQNSNGTVTRVSPHLAQHMPATAHALARQAVTLPQSLSSGHVPPIVNIHHQIQNSNPNMSPQEVRHHATEQLKHMMSLSARQTAINSATGVHPQAHAALSSAGPQSPFPHAHQQQHQPSATPQMHPPASPYQQASMLRSLSNHSAQGHVVSPANAAAMLATPQQVQQPHQPQSQYSAQLRQQMYAQQRQHQVSGAGLPVQGSGASPPAMHASPSFGAAMPAFVGAGPGRTPTPLGSSQMRPPSRSEGQGVVGQQPQQQQQHFGVKGQGPGQVVPQQRQAPSPRPPSAQGFGS